MRMMTTPEQKLRCAAKALDFGTLRALLARDVDVNAPSKGSTKITAIESALVSMTVLAKNATRDETVSYDNDEGRKDVQDRSQNLEHRALGEAEGLKCIRALLAAGAVVSTRFLQKIVVDSHLSFRTAATCMMLFVNAGTDAHATQSFEKHSTLDLVVYKEIRYVPVLLAAGVNFSRGIKDLPLAFPYEMRNRKEHPEELLDRLQRSRDYVDEVNKAGGYQVYERRCRAQMAGTLAVILKQRLPAGPLADVVGFCLMFPGAQGLRLRDSDIPVVYDDALDGLCAKLSELECSAIRRQARVDAETEVKANEEVVQSRFVAFDAAQKTLAEAQKTLAAAQGELSASRRKLELLI